jgi:hypothetical protein
MGDKTESDDVFPKDRSRAAEQGYWSRINIEESMLHERFITNCRSPKYYSMFSAAKLERFTYWKFPRILLDPGIIDGSSLKTSKLEADLRYLLKLLKANPKKFVELANSLDNPDKCLKLATKIGLTEDAFINAGGGLLWLVAIVAALVLTGCPGPAPPAAPPAPPCPMSNPIDQEPCIIPATRHSAGLIGIPHRGASGRTW